MQLIDYGAGLDSLEQGKWVPHMTIMSHQTDSLNSPLRDQTETMLSFNTASVLTLTLYRLCVHTLNKKTLSVRTDTPWRRFLGLNTDVKPVVSIVQATYSGGYCMVLLL